MQLIFAKQKPLLHIFFSLICNFFPLQLPFKLNPSRFRLPRSDPSTWNFAFVEIPSNRGLQHCGVECSESQRGTLMRETHLGKSTKQSNLPIKRHNNKYLSPGSRGGNAANILSPQHRPQPTATFHSPQSATHNPPTQPPFFGGAQMCGSKCRKTNVKWNCFRCCQQTATTPTDLFARRPEKKWMNFWISAEREKIVRKL